MQETGGMETYSTEEQIVGYWNGKAIYSKILCQSVNVPSGGYSIDVSALNLKQIIDVGGFTSSHVLPFSNPWSHFYFDLSTTKVAFCPYSGTSGVAVSDVTIWIKYTKTTD